MPKIDVMKYDYIRYLFLDGKKIIKVSNFSDSMKEILEKLGYEVSTHSECNPHFWEKYQGKLSLATTLQEHLDYQREYNLADLNKSIARTEQYLNEYKAKRDALLIQETKSITGVATTD